MSTHAVQHRTRLTAAVVRSLGDRTDVTFRGQQLTATGGPVPVHAPHVRLPPDRLDGPAARGLADALSLRLRGSDPELHAVMLPEDPLAAVVVETAEQVRTESLVPTGLPGVQRNLDALFDTWFERACADGWAESEVGVHLLVLALVIRSRVALAPLSAHQEDFCEAVWFSLATELGGHVRQLRRRRLDQAAYAEVARALAAAWVGVLDDPQAAATSAPGALLEPPPTRRPGDASPTAARRDLRALLAAGPSYGVWDPSHDVQQRASQVARAEQLRDWLAEVDRTRPALRPTSVTRQVLQVWPVSTQEEYHGGHEEGLVDGARLAGLVARPHQAAVFRRPEPLRTMSTSVTLLLDCSGSMRRHARAIASWCDALGHGLDAADVEVEVLGFTTADWHGQSSVRSWRAAGSPTGPGRMGAVRHLVLKDADEPWRRGRRGLAALLRPDLYKEGIDGEALAWAATRLLARPTERKVLLVVSDGGPMETATRDLNGPSLLDDDLRRVAEALEDDGRVLLRALGIGADLSPFYSVTESVDLVDELSHEQARRALRLLVRPGRR